jgi:cytochrome c
LIKTATCILLPGTILSTPPSGSSNLDERPGHENSDDQRTAGNTNDLRGKILRIHPEDDGSYTIPEGNLFPEGTEKTRPEIYTMGHRNPWRVSIDSKTGYIYWGEVGPDASEDNERGPRGYDEFNQAKGPGFFGWPYFIADNKPYVDYDHTDDSYGEPFDVNNPVNTSANNTGLEQLPPPQKAFLWYPYGYSEEFPLMGSAGRSATGGPVFRQADFPESDKRWPAYYEGKWLIIEFMRGWIMAVTMDENGNYKSMERLLPEENFSSAIDMKFSPDGDLYVLEYGSAWFRGNQNAHVKQIQYNGGNRMPIVQASADKMAGAVPLNIQLSSDGTEDYDNDKLSFAWNITAANGFVRTLTDANPKLMLEDPGIYKVNLIVTDEAGNSNEQSFELVAGNAPPEVDIVVSEGNQSFFFAGKEISYKIKVKDKEDGSLEEGGINEEEIAINFDYTPEGFDPIEIAQNHVSSDEWVSFSRGKNLIKNSDCFACHREKVKSIGPSYLAVAQKYQNETAMKSVLAGRVINGSVGRWGEHAMSAHPDLSQEDAESMIEYVLSLDDPKQTVEEIPLSGTYTTTIPEGQNGKGGYLLRAAYTDKGADDLQALTAEKIIALRNPVIDAENYDIAQGTELMTTPSRMFNMAQDGAFVGFKNLDLTGVGSIEINAEASSRAESIGGVIEVRLGSPDGTLVGQTEKLVPIQIDFRAEMQKLVAEWEKGGKKGPRPGWREVREKFQPSYSVNLGGVEGFHDLYFVVRNPEAKPGQILLQMRTVTFKHAAEPDA